MANQKNNTASKKIFFINLAFEQAKINLGSTDTNPSVGCVIEKEGSIISSGVTSLNGRPHAEFNALKKKKNFINSNLYVSLEPCSHFGKTPPCTTLIKKKKISKVFYSINDYDNRSKNKAKKVLKKNKINFYKIPLTKNNKDFYKSYYLQHNSKYPLVDAKIAVSNDYFTKSKKKKWITNDHSRKRTHYLRSLYSCILSTYKTINDDNSMFNCRIDGLEEKSPDLFIIDRFLKLKRNLKLMNTNNKRKIFIFTTISKSRKANYFKKKGIKLILLNKLDKKNDFKILLKKIKKTGYSRVFLETGVTSLSLFIKFNLLNELYIFKSDKNLSNNGLIYFKLSHFKKRLKMINVNLFDNKLYKIKFKNV